MFIPLILRGKVSGSGGTTITVGVTADSAVTPTVIISLFDSEGIALVLNLSTIYA